jgi:xylan 1,4-beta-xylosidase
MNSYVNPLHLPNSPHGLGDPYVLRHNGRFYLYPSTPRNENGVHVWISKDLVNWEDGGWVVRDACLQNCYAPEVYYFNGRFLLVGSPFGQGHYIYESDSPTGPFTQLKGNIGWVIDGSIFADDDAQLFFTHAEYPCIYGHKMGPDGSMGEAVVMEGTGMGHWTEGPGIFKRQGKYYITMTGNHLLSRAYRIDYAISDTGPLGPYRVPRQKTLLVNTDRAHGSLGHSSNTIGPDLDSYWICYHNFEINDRGQHTRRNVNLDRMLFNGEKLAVSGPTRHFAQAPQMPDAYGWADDAQYADSFIPWSDGVQLKAPAPEQFTAEVWLVPGARAEVCFGHQDADNYGFLLLEDGQLTLGEIALGAARTIAQRRLFEGFDAQVPHTVRLEMRAGRLNVLIDQMNQIEGAPVGPRPGRFGARGAARIGHMAFSRHVAQRGDFEHFHAVPGPIDAAMFLPACCGALKGGGHPPSACGFRPEDGIRLVPGADGGQDVIIGEDEQLSFRINAAASGTYHIQAVLQAQDDCEVELALGQGGLTAALAPSDALKNVALGQAALCAGLHSFSIRCAKGQVRIARFEIFPVAPAIKGEWKGLPLCFVAHQVEGMGSDGFLARHEGLQMDREVQAMAMFGERFLTDGSIEAGIRFRGDGADKSAGLFLRLSENSYHTDQIPVGHRGYFIGFDMQTVRVDRMNFDAHTLAGAPCPLEKERTYRIKAGICGGEIVVWLDGREVLRVCEADPLPYGQLAVGSFGARITVEWAAVDAQ